MKALACCLFSPLAAYSSKCSKLGALNTGLVLPQVPCLASTTSQGRPRSYDPEEMLDLFGGRDVLLAWKTRKTVEEPLQKVRSAGPGAAAAGTDSMAWLHADGSF